MSVHPVCVQPNPVLRAPAAAVEAFTNDLHALVRDLIETMYAHDGIGLAAPQIGRALQVCVANPLHTRGQEVVLVNPTLNASSGRTAVTEGCLSIPNVWAKVTRAAWVRLRGQDIRGQSLQLEAEGLLAIVLQHELDHLHGRLFIDRLSWCHRRRLATRVLSRKGTGQARTGCA